MQEESGISPAAKQRFASAESFGAHSKAKCNRRFGSEEPAVDWFRVPRWLELGFKSRSPQISINSL